MLEELRNLCCAGFRKRQAHILLLFSALITFERDLKKSEGNEIIDF